MLHVRLIVPPELTASVLERLSANSGVVHIVQMSASTTTRPDGDVVLCDVAREAANDIVEWLQDQGVHHRGAITVETLDTVVSDAAAAAEAVAPGHGTDALVWEEMEARVRHETVFTVSYATFMAISAMIASVGILLDSPILVIGAMVVGPEFGALAGLCVAIVRRRHGPAQQASATLAGGLIVAAAAALVATVFFRLTELAPDEYRLGERQLTAFISNPDGMAAAVAILAGIVGMLALTEGRTSALMGVLVSATTIPAAANMGVATAYREWGEVGGAALQLGINLVALVVAGTATLAVQARYTTRRPARSSRLGEYGT